MVDLFPRRQSALTGRCSDTVRRAGRRETALQTTSTPRNANPARLKLAARARCQVRHPRAASGGARTRGIKLYVALHSSRFDYRRGCVRARATARAGVPRGLSAVHNLANMIHL